MSVYYKWFRKFFGSSRLEIKGENEKLLNTLMEKGVYFWGTEVTESGSLVINGSVFSAGGIIDEAERLGCEVNVLERKGLPFIVEKYKKRYGIMVGMVIAWAILFLSSLVVWEVRVADRSGEDPQKIRGYLEKCGLEMGTFLPELNVRAVENQFLIEHPEYSFIAVNIGGTVANVELRRATSAGELENLDVPSNVIASRSGTVISVEAFGGSPAVKRGDRVEKGDLLISSFMEGSFGVTRSVHAYGKVTAAVGYEFKTEIPLRYEITQLTGRVENKVSLGVLCFELSLFSDEKTSFEKCGSVSENNRLELFGIKLPVEVEKTVYSETENAFVNLTRDGAEAKAAEEYDLWKRREVKGEILSEATDVVFDEERGVCVFTASLTVSENIAEVVPVG